MIPGKSAIILFKGGGAAFIDGMPETCDHKEEDAVYVSSSGKVVHWHTYRQWAHLTTQARYPLIIDYHDQIEDPIVEFTTECRSCKRIYRPPMFDV